ncbi:hypothetical protein PV458_31370 [Streptomyces sp. MN03-5084-2B]|nr:hypothetical protein [Streptomyces sp. MN03-5084-2B]
MQDSKMRLMWTVLAIVLPGPWTPIIVLAYLLNRAAEDRHGPGHHLPAMPYCPPDPYACVPAPAPARVGRNPYAPPQLTGSK